MKKILLSSLLLNSSAFAQNSVQDMQAVISVQQSVISQLKNDLLGIKQDLNAMKEKSYTKVESDARFMNLTQAQSFYSKIEADARFMNLTQAGNYYTKVESDSRHMLQAQSGNFISSSERSSFQKKVSAYMANCTWNDTTHYYTCSCGPSDIAVSAGAAAWGGDSIKELFPVNINSWQVTCIDHDKQDLASQNKCMRWSQVICLKI